MERVFKIKTRSEPDISNQYPSERRYSASMVLGLSTVLLIFSLFAFLLGSLVVHKIYVFEDWENATQQLNVTTNRQLEQKLERDLQHSDRKYLHYYINIPLFIAGGCFLMGVGDILAVAAGMLAWKRWYIDQNITIFFVTCCMSTLLSAIAFVISVITFSNTTFSYNDFSITNDDLNPVSVGLAVNATMLSLLSTIWSLMAGKVAYNGMRNRYPDDIMDKGGRVQVTTIRKGSPAGAISNIPVEVLMHSFAMGRMVKYLPKVDTHGLPKEESSAEYEQRVNNFLNAHVEQGGSVDGKG